MRDKLERLGFTPAALGMSLSVGRVKINTVEGPFGLVIWFKSFATRSMTQFDVTAPYSCSDQAIARLVLLNVSEAFPDSLADFIVHFQRHGVPLC